MDPVFCEAVQMSCGTPGVPPPDGAGVAADAATSAIALLGTTVSIVADVPPLTNWATDSKNGDAVLPEIYVPSATPWPIKACVPVELVNAPFTTVTVRAVPAMTPLAKAPAAPDRDPAIVVIDPVATS
jgi:hypothetical protein